MSTVDANKLLEVGQRIREMRVIESITEAEMAARTEVALEDYLAYEAGQLDFPFTFLHKCAKVLGVGMTDLLEGQSAHLSSYTVTRKGKGFATARENGIEIRNLAPLFRSKLAEPYYVKYAYDPQLQDKPIHLTNHSGQEFDYILRGRLKVQVGEHTEILDEGDSILYNSATPHGMIAIDGEDCLFLAVVIPGENESEPVVREGLLQDPAGKVSTVADNFIDCVEDAKGVLQKITFKNEESFNFGFDVVDAIARRTPEKLAMLHISRDGEERRFTFADIKRMSNQVANYFSDLGVRRGDRVMLVLKRHYQFWLCMVALHKLGAVAIPASNQLQSHDFEYRFRSAGISAIVCTADGDTAHQAEIAAETCPELRLKLMVNGTREGWQDFNEKYPLYSTHFRRRNDSPCGSDLSLMFFTSGTTGYPKIAAHSYKYALGHYITAKYWHGAERDGLHFTISDTGWGKALWGKLYGQWLCECAVFVYDFDRFDASAILPMFQKHKITSFCAPPTMLRMMVKQDISQYDFSSVRHMTTAGEALNPEVYRQFEKATGLHIMEGFGQTETTMVIGNLMGADHKIGSMGKASPLYDVMLMDADGKEAPIGQTGEIVIKTSEQVPCGLFMGYYRDDEKTKEAWHDGYYHTGDVAWKDEDGFFWYVSRVDDVIKSSGYRIGPFEIESVIMELPYVLECGVSAAPDEVRGQIVKASIVLVPGKEGTDELKKEIQNYVKEHTAPYKYPRLVVFRDSLPKATNGKIQRNKL